MTTQRPRLISMHDALTRLSVEPGQGSNELFVALSIASARFEASGGALDRIGRRLSHSQPLKPSGNSGTAPTTSPGS